VIILVGELIMSVIFDCSFGILKKYVARVDPDGDWRDLKYDGKQYRTRSGAVLNWWRKSGKILFQGYGPAALKFEQAFKALAMRKGRLSGENGKDLRVLESENETLRALIADVMLENIRLKKLSEKLEELQIG
jgi:stage V sporulation protein SpoVS